MKLPLMGGVGPAAETSSHLTSAGARAADAVPRRLPYDRRRGDQRQALCPFPMNRYRQKFRRAVPAPLEILPAGVLISLASSAFCSLRASAVCRSASKPARYARAPIASSGSAPAATPLTDRGVKPLATAAGCHFGGTTPVASAVHVNLLRRVALHEKK